MAQMTLLHTGIKFGFRFCTKKGKHSAIKGCTWGKQALVRSPSRANAD